MKKNILLGTIAIMLLMVGTVLAVGPEDNPNPNWQDEPGNALGSVGHINPALDSREWIYPGTDDCGSLNGQAESGSQQTLPDAVAFPQAPW